MDQHHPGDILSLSPRASTSWTSAFLPTHQWYVSAMYLPILLPTVPYLPISLSTDSLTRVSSVTTLITPGLFLTPGHCSYYVPTLLSSLPQHLATHYPSPIIKGPFLQKAFPNCFSNDRSYHLLSMYYSTLWIHSGFIEINVHAIKYTHVECIIQWLSS